jgi:hypothetical protein
MKVRSLCFAAAVQLVLPLYATGAEVSDQLPAPSIFSFSGFGTVGVVHSSEANADFTNNAFSPNGAGYTRSWSPEVDSLIGAQLSVRVTRELSAVLQVIVQQNYDGTFSPHVEWANIKYQFTPDLSVRIGRVELPTFLFSDSRKVGYTYPWVRPPIEVYSLLPITASDGAGFSYRLHLADVTNTTQASLVQSNTSQPFNRGTALARNSLNIANTTEYKAFTFRASYQNAHLLINSFDGLLDGFKLFGPQGIAIYDKYSPDNKTITTEIVGGSYDPGRWFVISEWGHTDLNSILGEDTSWYASGGYRVGQFTPYMTYAHETAARNSDPGLTLTGLPPAQAGFAAGLNAGLNAVLRGVADQSTVSIGARWDCVKDIALKIQFDHMRIGAHSSGTLINVQPEFQPGGTVNLFNIAVDFVF